MDEQEMIRFLRSELYQAMERDPELRTALQHIDAGKGTFQDTAQYSERTSELLGQILSRHVDELPEGMRETVCKALLRERYEEVNGICAEVQEQLDAQNGIRLQPQRASYPAERVQQVAHALEDPTVLLSVIQRRARAPVANVSKSFHDDYMKKNADVRSRLGFKCYINRVAAAGCCKWCTEIAGQYIYGDEPEEVFHRHDNCGCTVTYENGRERQDVWSKRKWQEDPAEVEARANEPVVNSQERAREIEQRGLAGLTKPGNGSIINIEGMFRKDGDDPLFEVTGRAIDSNPDEVEKMIAQLQEWGVTINRGQSTLGYGCIRNGEPGAMSITDDASYGAWRHEFDHAKKDHEAGWNGVRVLWFDPEEHERRERAAYEIEIQLARDAKREDIVQRLEANRDAEIKKIWHDYHERFGYPE